MALCERTTVQGCQDLEYHQYELTFLWIVQAYPWLCRVEINPLYPLGAGK